ncbi:hypothetical protein DVH05_018239 [Phytophthora capsici]|nr:hypothetical protein DVH05_018239 [Phytophthora capsici]
MSLGAVCSPASHMFRPDELAVQIKAAKAKFIITHADLESTAVVAAKLCSLETKFIYTLGHHSADGRNLPSVNELVQHDDDNFEFEQIDPHSNVMLPFSSGTTGIPKGVALSARNMLSNVLQINHVENLGGHSLGLMPFFHIYGIMLMHLSIYQGASKVILPRFEPDTFLNALATYKVSRALPIKIVY